MAILKQSTAYTRMVLLIQSSDHITGLTGASPTVTLSKAGGAFGALGGSVTEVSSGWYKISLNTSDTGTLGDLAYHITATSGDPTDFVDQVTVDIPGGSVSSVTGNVTVGTIVAAASNFKKNTALNNFEFVMTDSTTHAPKTGLTITAQRSIDGGALGACANSATELSNGVYIINLAASDLNANVVTLRFSSTGADDKLLTIITQP